MLNEGLNDKFRMRDQKHGANLKQFCVRRKAESAWITKIQQLYQKPSCRHIKNGNREKSRRFVRASM